MSQPTFGLRSDLRTSRPREHIRVASFTPGKAAPENPAPRLRQADRSLDEELREWARTRQGFKVPWRQLTFMASLCFGSASFLLPDSVNGAVQWILFGLTAASLIATFTRRRAERRA